MTYNSHIDIRDLILIPIDNLKNGYISNWLQNIATTLGLRSRS
mgnify:CR=1 FL=1